LTSGVTKRWRVSN